MGYAILPKINIIFVRLERVAAKAYKRFLQAVR